MGNKDKGRKEKKKQPKPKAPPAPKHEEFSQIATRMVRKRPRREASPPEHPPRRRSPARRRVALRPSPSTAGLRPVLNPPSPGCSPACNPLSLKSCSRTISARQCAPVAQLDRVFGYEPKGREFESLRAHHPFLPQIKSTPAQSPRVTQATTTDFVTRHCSNRLPLTTTTYHLPLLPLAPRTCPTMSLAL